MVRLSVEGPYPDWQVRLRHLHKVGSFEDQQSSFIEDAFQLGLVSEPLLLEHIGLLARGQHVLSYEDEALRFDLASHSALGLCQRGLGPLEEGHQVWSGQVA